jgi:hypothetical protein
MVGLALVKSLYAIPTWTRTVALVQEYAALQTTLGCSPSVYAAYRFAAKLRTYSTMLDGCIARVLASLHAEISRWERTWLSTPPTCPRMRTASGSSRRVGVSVPMMGSPIPMQTGHIHLVAVVAAAFAGRDGRAAPPRSTRTGLPLAWQTRTARANESNFAAPLIDKARAHGFAAETCALDRGYDLETIYAALEDRDCRPIMPLRQTPAVKAGQHKPPTCQHGECRFAGSDYTRKASKWRCPTGECKPASQWGEG